MMIIIIGKYIKYKMKYVDKKIKIKKIKKIKLQAEFTTV